MPGRKKHKKESNASQGVQKPVERVLVFEQEFREDLGWWYRNDTRKAFKVLDIVQDILREPFSGIGKPEPLKYLDPDTWSRRIDLEHRVVYRVTNERIYFLQARYHYN